MDPNVIRDHNVAFIFIPLLQEVTSYVYIDVILEELFSSFITNSKLSLLLEMLLFRNSINQSINQCSEPHFVA